jgi:hypothetical protein
LRRRRAVNIDILDAAFSGRLTSEAAGRTSDRLSLERRKQ